MKRNKGFTLVELLVVIGIIALLISILLPTLGRAKWQAQVIQCSARMRDVVLAVQMYANDNKGYIPPLATDTGKANWNMLSVAGKTAPTESDTLNVMFQQSDVKGATKWDDKKDTGALLGRLYRTKYLKTAKTFSCPSSKFSPNVENPKVAEDLRNFGFYVLNFHMAYKDSAGTVLQPWWKRLANYGKTAGVTNWSLTTPQPEFRKAILGEPMFSKNVDGTGNPADDLQYITHALGKRRAFNMAYPDGSVLAYFDNNFASRPVDRMSRYLELANAIQHNLDGGTVNFAVSGWNNKGYASIPTVP